MPYLILDVSEPDGVTVIPNPGVCVLGVADGDFEQAVVELAKYHSRQMAAAAVADDDVVTAVARDLGDAYLASDGPATTALDGPPELPSRAV
jgi:hypothetical protein